MYFPLMFIIPWKRLPILLGVSLVHLGLSGLFMRCRYSWSFIVSGQITKFMSPGWIVIFPVSLSIITYYFPFWCMEVYGGGWGVGLGSAIVVIWFDVTFFHVGAYLLCCTSWLMGCWWGLHHTCLLLMTEDIFHQGWFGALSGDVDLGRVPVLDGLYLWYFHSSMLPGLDMAIMPVCMCSQVLGLRNMTELWGGGVPTSVRYWYSLRLCR